MITKNILISGGDTTVTAIGDQTTSMPGIGSGGGSSKVSEVKASPEEGYQGYIQDGTSETDYTFTDETPFSETQDIVVTKFFTMVYFGPYRDVNQIDKESKEQIGANHIISRTGGKGFTKEQLKSLSKVIGKNADGSSISDESIVFDDEKQIDVINKAKTENKVGDFLLAFRTESGTKVTVTVSLRDDGTDAGEYDPGNPIPLIGANNFEKETGGDPFTEEELINYAQLKGKDSDGNNIDLKEIRITGEQMKKINEAKTAGKAGTFELTYTTKDGLEVSVEVRLVGEYDEINSKPGSSEMIKAKNIISKTAGSKFTEQQVKILSMVKAVDEKGADVPTEDLSLAGQEELKKLNEAKTAGKVGDYPLTFRTPDGTSVIILVFLRKEGYDSADYEPQNPNSFIGADNGVTATGGEVLSSEEAVILCKAKGKDKNGDNAQLNADEKQLLVINRAKAAGKTGTFDLKFYMEDGSEVTVKVTLTGKHTVTFDADGGSENPQPQTVEGGECAIKPEDPVKQGYVFEGWYFILGDENEAEWDFSSSVHEDIALKAKWTKEKEAEAAGTTEKETKNTENKGSSGEWKYQEITKKKGQKNSPAVKTGEKSKAPWMYACAAGATGIAVFCFINKRIKK